jgi:Uma2 family endonuclease
MELLTRKFTVDQYHQMADQGILHCQERLELIAGEIINMSPIGFRHAFITTYLANWFSNQLKDRAIVATQNPIYLGNWSEPQPDLVLLTYYDHFYDYRLPEAADILLLVEVADSSLTYDRQVKIPLYAQHDIPEVWLINLTQNRLERHSQPDGQTYQTVTLFSPQQTLAPLAFPELELPLNRILR